MHEWIQEWIQKERARRKQVKRFIEAAQPFMVTLRDEARAIIAEYENAFPKEVRITAVLEGNGLLLRIKRWRTRNSLICEIKADALRRNLLVTQLVGSVQPFPVSVGFTKEGTLALVTQEPTPSGFLRALMPPILFPDLSVELGYPDRGDFSLDDSAVQSHSDQIEDV